MWFCFCVFVLYLSMQLFTPTYTYVCVYIYTDKHLTYQGRGVSESREQYVVVSHSVAYVDDLLHVVSRFVSQAYRCGYTETNADTMRTRRQAHTHTYARSHARTNTHTHPLRESRRRIEANKSEDGEAAI